MAKYLNAFRFSYGVVLLAACCAFPIAYADTLPDPTQPPTASRADGETDQSASLGPVLQSVLVAPGRRVAVISGQTVHIGDKFAGSTVTKIAEDEVVLREGASEQTLKLFPDIKKRSGVKDAKPKAKSSKGKS